MFDPGKLFQPSLMFAGKAEDYPSEAPFWCSTLGYAPALLTNIRLGWNALPGANVIAYFKNM